MVCGVAFEALAPPEAMEAMLGRFCEATPERFCVMRLGSVLRVEDRNVDGAVGLADGFVVGVFTIGATTFIFTAV